jgi:hypothetical protein
VTTAAANGGDVPLEAAAAIAAGRGFVLEHRVAAPVDEVWRVLTDGAGYAEWNAFVVGVDGAIAPEADVVLRVRLFGRLRRSPHRVTWWDPPRGFGWRQTLPPRWLLRGERRHVLEPRPEGGTRYRDVFWLAGPLAGPAARAMLAQVRAGMEEAARGLGERVAR